LRRADLAAVTQLRPLDPEAERRPDRLNTRKKALTAHARSMGNRLRAKVGSSVHREGGGPTN
jgi:hypothetical protein